TAVEGTAPWQQVLAHFGADEQANPTAAALTVPFTALPRHRPAHQVQFSSVRRWSAVTFAQDAGPLAGHWVLGAPEIMRSPDAEQDESVTQLLAHTDSIAAQGLRTMLLTWAPAAAPEGGVATRPLQRGEPLPDGLQPVALLTFKENVRRDAAETLEYFRE